MSFKEPEARVAGSTPEPVLTFVLVSVQKVLELGVEDLQMLLDQDLFTLAGQLVLGGLVEVDLHPALLLQQTGLSLEEERFQRKEGGRASELPPFSCYRMFETNLNMSQRRH